MAYYDTNGKKFNHRSDSFRRLDVGGCAEIFTNDDIIWKKYFFPVNDKYRITPEVFELLKTFTNPNFIELYNIYMERGFFHFLPSKEFSVDAYTAKYYRGEEINILEQSVDYLIDNFSRLERLFDAFTSEHIVTDDIKFHNTVLTSDSIIIIDPDCFRVDTSLSEREISRENKKNLWKLFQSVCINCYKDYRSCGTTLARIVHKSNPDGESDYENMALQLSKRLKPYKKTINYFRN